MKNYLLKNIYRSFPFVLLGADISGHVQKNKKDKVKRSDTDKVKYLEYNKIAS